MATRQVDIAGIGTVKLYKRRGVRSMKLSIGHGGAVRVTLPLWAPYKLGTAFIEQKRSWILQQRPVVQPLVSGMHVGKAHTLVFREVRHLTKPLTRLVGTEVRISVPFGMDHRSEAVQAAARKACSRALKQEAARLLPDRVAILAEQHGFTYRSVAIKELRGRWGSCNQHKDIVLNSFLMQLPWHLIDYVILHELLHTRILAHGRQFWAELGGYVQDLKIVRKTMKEQQPTLVIVPAIIE